MRARKLEPDAGRADPFGADRARYAALLTRVRALKRQRNQAQRQLSHYDVRPLLFRTKLFLDGTLADLTPPFDFGSTSPPSSPPSQPPPSPRTR